MQAARLSDRLSNSSTLNSLHAELQINHIDLRDDAPDDFAYAVAKALDEHRELFQVQLEPWYYDPQTVAVSKVIPMHPGAMKYYRERGFAK